MAAGGIGITAGEKGHQKKCENPGLTAFGQVALLAALTTETPRA
jgi:hypothetical protein